MAEIYFDEDADLGVIQNLRVAVLGYGSAGQAHALNLRDSGVEVCIGLRESSRAQAKAVEQGFEVQSVPAAVSAADVVAILLSQPAQIQIYEAQVAPYLAPHAAVIFTEGFNIRYGYVQPALGHDVCLVTPQGGAHELRDAFVAGQGVPGTIAVPQDATGKGWDLAKSYAAALGLTRAGVIATTLVQATEAALFGEQAVLGGGLTRLIQSGFETLVEAGYEPEVAYFEVCHGLLKLARRISESGLAGMHAAFSDLAEYGDYVSGARIITPEVKAHMEEILSEIQNGVFAARFVADQNAGAPELKSLRAANENHEIERVGAQVRRLSPRTPQ